MDTRSENNYQPIFETTYQYWLSQGVYIVTKLEIAQFLRDDKKNITELREILKEKFPRIDENNLYRVLRNLSAVGIFKEDANRNFTLTSLGQELLNPKIHDFILQTIGQENWSKIVDVGKSGDFKNFKPTFMQDGPQISPELLDVILAYRYSKALYLFVKFGLADNFNDKPLSISDLASKSKIDPEVIETICLLLSKKNILKKMGDGQFSLTEAGNLLRSDYPQSLKNVALHENIAKWQAAENLLVAVTEGKEPFEVTHKEGLFDYLKKLENKDQQEFDIFNKAMAEISKIEIKAITQNLMITTNTKTVMDVGGGTGALMMALLQQHEKLNGIIFDLPETIQQIQNPGPRCKAIGGSFFDKDSIPKSDMILLKRALHDWSNDKAIDILKNCAEKCNTLRVIEWLWKDNPFVASLDLFLMSIGGKIRSEGDFRFLLESAGINCSGIHELTTGVFAVEGIPNKKLEERLEIPPQSVSAMIDRGSVYTSSQPHSNSSKEPLEFQKDSPKSS